MNCIVIDDDKLSRRIIEEFIKKIDFLDLVASFDNAVDAISLFKAGNEINLIFLDIEMPEMTGIEFIKTLKSPPQIIIISSKEQYAIQAFEYDVTDYLLKPVAYGRFFKAADKAYSLYVKNSAMPEGRNEIFIKKNSSLIRLKYEDILWVEALENYVIVNTYDDKFTIHFTMKSIEKKLPVTKFSRVHRSYIVNTSRINLIEDNSILIPIKGTGAKEEIKSIPIGKSYKDKLMNDLNLMIK
jgi:DNA-binding LytR/AlgR family response regulator